MKTIEIGAKIRQKEQKRKDFPKMIPSILYGKGMDNVMLWIDGKKFGKTISEAGESTIIDLAVENQKEPQKVLVYDIQKDPVSEDHIHVDFFRIKMDEEIETEVELEFTGESPAVKEKGGVLIKNIDSVKVRCLPADLPGSITVDISSLKTFDDYIYVENLPVSDRVEIDLDGKTVIALVAPPRSEEELEELEGEVEADISQVEGMEKEPEEEAKSADKDKETKQTPTEKSESKGVDKK